MSSYSRMIVIPQDEYAQLSSMQQVRQPLADQLYRSERDYQQNLQIKDPNRAVLLQSETVERLKELKDQMRHYLSISTPRVYRSRAESLFESIKNYLNVNEKGEIIKDDNSIIESSRFEDLIQHAVRDRRRNFIPTGWKYFIELLRNHNVPRASLNRETMDELDSHVTNVKTLKPSKLAPPKKWGNRSASPSYHSPRSSPFLSPKISPSTQSSSMQSRSRKRTRSRSGIRAPVKRKRAPPKKFTLLENY